jgi:hypothetical protein
MNDNYSEQKICCFFGCTRQARRTGKYCLYHHIKLMAWLKLASKKVYSYEQLNLCPSKNVINTRSLYNEYNETDLRNFEYPK